MLRSVDIPLMDFCARQYSAFCSQAWIESTLPQRELGVAAGLLAHTPWYGHREELLCICQQLNPDAALDLIGQMRSVELYPARFVQMVQKQAQFL